MHCCTQQGRNQHFKKKGLQISKSSQSSLLPTTYMYNIWFSQRGGGGLLPLDPPELNRESLLMFNGLVQRQGIIGLGYLSQEIPLRDICDENYVKGSIKIGHDA